MCCVCTIELVAAVIGGVAGGLLLLMAIILIACIVVQRKTKGRFANLTTTVLASHFDSIISAGLHLQRHGRAECADQVDSTYEYIDDYQTVPSRKNQYVMPHLHQQREARPESPYQDMQSVDPTSSKNFHACNLTYTAPPTSMGHYNHAPDPTPNNDMHVTPGGSVVYRSRGSARSTEPPAVESGAGPGEGEYTAMSSVGAVAANHKEIMAGPLSVTVPENAPPYNGQLNGEYRYTEC